MAAKDCGNIAPIALPGTPSEFGANLAHIPSSSPSTAAKKANRMDRDTAWMKRHLPSDYIMSDGEMDNLIYLTLKHGCDSPMRQTDKAVVLRMFAQQEKAKVGSDGIANLIMEAAVYGWDQILGKPDDPMPLTIARSMWPRIVWSFKHLTREQRSDTSVVSSEPD